MEEWKEISIEGVVINKIVAEFEIWTANRLPVTKIRIKIFETPKGTFEGLPNLRIKNHNDNTIDGISGLGATIVDALKDTLIYFFDLTADYEKLYGRVLIEDDFVWTDHEDF